MAQAPTADPEVQAAAQKAHRANKKLTKAAREALQAAAQLDDMLVGKGIVLEIDDTTAGDAGEGDAR